MRKRRDDIIAWILVFVFPITELIVYRHVNHFTGFLLSLVFVFLFFFGLWIMNGYQIRYIKKLTGEETN